MARERILLKISGGNLKKNEDISFFNNDIFANLMDQIEELIREYDVALVVGGGNIWRGNSNIFSFLEESSAHHIGMLATLMNAIAIQNYLNKRGIRNRIYSAFPCPKIAEDLNEENVKRSLDSGEVVIFGAGTGMPFVSTDTCAAIRAIEIGVSKILVGKHNVKGVFDKDPHTHSDAKFLEKLSYEEILSMKLDVFDRTALALLASRNVKIFVFNQNTKDSFVKVLRGGLEHTVIY